LRGPTGIIEVSNITDLYGSEGFCTWNVTVRPGRTISVKFLTMQILSYESCSNRYVLVSINLKPDNLKILAGLEDVIVMLSLCFSDVIKYCKTVYFVNEKRKMTCC